ncbi:TorD/DmsD family molecular chaperone [Azohydromonas aeria]|uniref:TorD/DmsD family molecular chaperone n=1 Tax=Azohydromonas aeria TaxID=2590212 RepID=UPI0012F99142|nr:molecular chaperone TorD family protein [Azohydromonas aeria]
MSPPHPVDIPLPPHEQSRADLYGLLGRLLLAPPDDALLAALAAAPPLDGGAAHVEDTERAPLARTWDALRAAARGDGDAICERHAELFVSTAQPLLNPYASLYLAGHLLDVPLARLRDDLARLGLRRRAGVGEPEDHLGALCEVMRLLITGAPGLPRRTTAQQGAFFDTHIGPWAGRCLDDIDAAAGVGPGGAFLSALAAFMHAFLALESQAFELEAEATDAEAAAPA